MKNSSLLKWANNKKATKDEKGGNEKKWLHSPETLKKGHVAYLVKFLGSTEVDKPKGIEVVKQGIQKLKFNQQLKKSEGQTKPPKVELTISVEGVCILEPKTKKVLHQYPLHKISYCADDRAEKRFFSFISKEEESDKHTCYVFVSDKLAEEITLTIGQAFELAYKNYLDTNGKELEQQKQVQSMKKRISALENENSVFRSRLEELAKLNEVKRYMADKNLSDLCHVEPVEPENEPENKSEAGKSASPDSSAVDGSGNKNTLINLDGVSGGGGGGSFGGDGFTLDDLNDLNDFNPRGIAGSSDDDDDFNPRAEPEKPQPPPAAHPPSTPLTLPPPALPPREHAKIEPSGQQPIPNLFQDPVVPAGVVNTNPFANSFPAGGGNAADPFGMTNGFGGGSAFQAPSSSSSTIFHPKPNKSIVSGFGNDMWGPTAAVAAPSGINSLEELDPLRK